MTNAPTEHGINAAFPRICALAHKIHVYQSIKLIDEI
jgi:hypothetical protein